MSNPQDVTLALARARHALANENRWPHTATLTTEAVERLCDALDGVVAALCAEPALRIDYRKVIAPAPADSPREEKK